MQPCFLYLGLDSLLGALPTLFPLPGYSLLVLHFLLWTGLILISKGLAEGRSGHRRIRTLERRRGMGSASKPVLVTINQYMRVSRS